MAYEERITINGKNVVLKREQPPNKVEVEEGLDHYPLIKANINSNDLLPTNYDQPNGLPLPLFHAENGVKIDLNKRTKHDMGYWHRSTENDELVFCYKGSVIWETELGDVELNPGEFVLIPCGIAHRCKPNQKEETNICIEI